MDGSSGNIIDVVGELHLDFGITAGAGNDTLTLTDFKNRYDLSPEVLTYAANFDLGGGLNFLNVDETAGILTTFDLFRRSLCTQVYSRWLTRYHFRQYQRGHFDQRQRRFE